MKHQLPSKFVAIITATLFMGGIILAQEQEDSAPPTTSATTAPSTRPAVNVVRPPAKETFHIYLLMGQSNMVGRDRTGMENQVENPRVLTLNADGQWVVARDPLHVKNGRIEPGVGPGLPFGLNMIKTDPNVTIGLVPCAVGGSGLRRWVKGGDLYEFALNRAKIAAKDGVLKGVLWHQGEADVTRQQNAETYGARLAKMFTDLRADLGVADLPIVVGQLGEFVVGEKYPFVETVRDALKKMPATTPKVGFADSTGLIDKGDKLHFNAESERELGARYAKAIQELQK